MISAFEIQLFPAQFAKWSGQKTKGLLGPRTWSRFQGALSLAVPLATVDSGRTAGPELLCFSLPAAVLNLSLEGSSTELLTTEEPNWHLAHKTENPLFSTDLIAQDSLVRFVFTFLPGKSISLARSR